MLRWISIERFSVQPLGIRRTDPTPRARPSNGLAATMALVRCKSPTILVGPPPLGEHVLRRPRCLNVGQIEAAEPVGSRPSRRRVAPTWYLDLSRQSTCTLVL